MPKNYAPLKQKIDDSIVHIERGTQLQKATKRGRDSMRIQISSFHKATNLREEVKELKKESIERLDELLKEFTANCEANGNSVFMARTGQDAINYILDLAQKKGAKLVDKSKSLTTEEIELNHFLEAEGINVVETDLGERIIQLAGEKPFHLVFPAVHKTQTEVAKIFSDAFGQQVPDDLQEIMKTIRNALKPIFLGSQIGITGANVLVAETGSIVLETNEGNARLVSSIPDVNVVVVGMEKVVETWEEAMKLVMAHPINATGTRLTNYVSIITQRLPLDAKPRELHVIILDNGRTKMRNDPWFREALSCIRCGACMNVCPTYGVVGGHVFGYIYPGPIGIPWTEEVHGLDKAGEFAHLCISCGLCKTLCPADIDIPMMIAKVKERDVKKNGQLTANKVLSRSDKFASVASATAPISNVVIQSRPSRFLMDGLLGVDKRRELPIFRGRTLDRIFPSILKQIENPRAKVVYFVDLFANYNEPEKIGARAVRSLQDAQLMVELPANLQTSGMPYISYGELDQATKIAKNNVSVLSNYVKQGYDVVATEPTATYCLREVYPKLLDFSGDSQMVSTHSYEFFEYLDRYSDSVEIPKRSGTTVGFHIPCHQRALSSGKFTIKFLEKAGYNVEVVETGTCCGMGGTFGLKKGELGYDLAVAVGKPLFDLFKQNSKISEIVTESSVCTMQLVDGTNLKVVHPFELLF